MDSTLSKIYFINFLLPLDTASSYVQLLFEGLIAPIDCWTEGACQLFNLSNWTCLPWLRECILRRPECSRSSYQQSLVVVCLCYAVVLAVKSPAKLYGVVPWNCTSSFSSERWSPGGRQTVNFTVSRYCFPFPICSFDWLGDKPTS